jgi:hypothetical protein
VQAAGYSAKRLIKNQDPLGEITGGILVKGDERNARTDESGLQKSLLQVG